MEFIMRRKPWRLERPAAIDQTRGDRRPQSRGARCDCNREAAGINRASVYRLMGLVAPPNGDFLEQLEEFGKSFRKFPTANRLRQNTKSPAPAFRAAGSHNSSLPATT